MTDKELDEWGVDFVRFYARFADVFRRKEPRAQAAKYLRGLMASVPRKNSWQVAEAVGDPIPDPMQRWLKAGVFEDMVHDLRMLMREIDDRLQEPRAAILDSRTLQSTPESGGCAGSDGHKRRKGSKVHMAVDTLGQLLAIVVAPANEQDRAQVGELGKQIQEVTGDSVEVAFVDQGYTGDKTAAAEAHGIRLQVVKLPTVKRGFVLLPRRWVIERSFRWMARFRRLVRDYERLAETLIGLHFAAFAILLTQRFVTFMIQNA